MTEKKPAAMSCFSDKYNRLHRQACFTVELRAAWQVGNGFFRFETTIDSEQTSFDKLQERKKTQGNSSERTRLRPSGLLSNFSKVA